MLFSNNSDNFTKKDYCRLFGLGALLGAVIFVLIYGVYVINPAYTNWIYYSDNDLKQHFMGWSHYKNTPWHFPVGLIDTLSYPVSISVIYTDSIPVIAFLFKLFSTFLPGDFQYFGLVGLLFYMLNGGTGVILLKRFIKSPYLSLLLSPFLIVSFPIIQRLFYHTALSAQWIIFLSLIIWSFDAFSADKKSIIRQIVYWGVMGFLCVGIHSYFLPMAGMILLSDRICCFLANRKQSKGKALLLSMYPLVSFCLIALITLWIFGAFYGSSSGEGYGLGTFGANLNTFINPGYYGALLPELGYENYFQYEGCGYLGAGIIVFSLFADVCLIIRASRKKLSLSQRLFKNSALPAASYIYVGVGLFLVSFLAATLPTISIGTHNLGTLPYPSFIYKAASIFRSNGRFIWTPMYLIMIVTLVLGSTYLEEILNNAENIKPGVKKLIFTGVIVILLCLQALDLSKMIKEKHEHFNKADYSYETIWDRQPLNSLTKGKSAFVFLYTDNDINMETAFYACKHNMSLNSFYFARDINDEVQKEINKYTDELRDGLIRDDTVYILRREDYEANKAYIDSLNAVCADAGENVIMVSK